MSKKNKESGSRGQALEALVRGAAYLTPVVTTLGSLALPGATVTAMPVQKNPAKVDVCHVNGQGVVNLISVSSNAVSAHIGHGDYLAVNGSCEVGET